MEKKVKYAIQLGVVCLILFGFLGLQMAWASTKISTTRKYAWSENTGWHNWRSTSAEVTIHDTYLEGYVWAENIGWIKLGYQTPPSGTYQNTSSTNWGVNLDSNTGALSGYAWSENVGWINFESTNSDATIGSDGWFDGYAWGQNVGWIHFQEGGGAKTWGVLQLLAQTVALTGPPIVTANVVSTAFTLTAQGDKGDPENVIADTVFDLTSDTPGTGTFYSDAAGTTVITQVTIADATSAITFYYKDTEAGATPTVTAAWNSGGSDLGSDTHQVTVAGPAEQVELTGPPFVTADVVSTAFTLTSQDGSGVPSVVTANTVFDLTSDTPGTGTFYSDAAGTTVITQVTIPSGASTAMFYYKDTEAGATPTVTGTWNSGGVDLGSANHQVTVAGPAEQVELTGPPFVTADVVSTAFTLTSQDGSGVPSVVTANTLFDLTSDTPGTATFYSDAAGTTVITQITIPGGASTATFYYKDTEIWATPIVTAAWNSGGVDLGSANHQVTVAGPAEYVELTGPPFVTANVVSTAFTLTSWDGAGIPSAVAVDTVFDLTSDTPGTATFYSDAAGTTEITQVAILSGNSSATFYYKDTEIGATPTVTAAWNSGGSDLGSATHQVEVAGPAEKVELTGPEFVAVNRVSPPFILISQDASGVPSVVLVDTVFDLTIHPAGTGKFYSDPAGTVEITELTIPAGTSMAVFYYMDMDTGTRIATATRTSGADLGSASLRFQVNPGVATIPTVNEWGMIIFCVLMAVAALVAIRRKARKPLLQ